MRTDIAWIQNAPGSLSKVMVPAGSKAPKKKLPVGGHAPHGGRVERLQRILADAPGVREPGQAGDEKQENSWGRWTHVTEQTL